MAELPLAFSDEERQYLSELLEEVLKETRVEEHRTRNLSYREVVVHREDVIKAILDKLRAAKS